ncbi:hypothetical protein AB0C12_24905 [Actinoplanes sp. NPDC048967]|uniref:hypothetical protein n=1 Tax=Actinoplanes sp. NPDC048967 TaxID=3155269 RepID=UPI0033E020E3
MDFTPAVFLNLGGGLAEVGGLWVAALGFRRTWRDFSGEQQRFLPSVTPTLDRLTTWLTRLFRTGLPDRATAIDLSGSVHFSDTATATMTYARLPSIADDPAGFAQMVQTRVDGLLQRTDELAAGLARATAAADARQRELTAVVEKLRAEAESRVRQIAVGGLRAQVLGWLMLIIGVVLQTVGNIV